MSITLILLVIFGLIMINSEYLATREPSTGRYRWVGELFYMRENLLFFSCLTLNFIFTLLILDLVFMLIRGNLELTKENGTIFKNGKYFITQNDIDRTELFNSNNHSVIFIYLKSLENALDKRESRVEKLYLKLFLLINKNKIQIRLTYLDQSVKNYQRIISFITE